MSVADRVEEGQQVVADEKGVAIGVDEGWQVAVHQEAVDALLAFGLELGGQAVAD